MMQFHVTDTTCTSLTVCIKYMVSDPSEMTIHSSWKVTNCSVLAIELLQSCSKPLINDRIYLFFSYLDMS